ncbi:MAG: Hsp20/alpha crystallin family protein [Sphaerobacteraceae bacterium]|nr:MAG: Hsp20/alpha crystallin family protein [Sphaerobacteraceae bacterium]
MNIPPRFGRQDIESMRNRLDRLLGDVGDRTWELLERSMPIDVFESSSHVQITASVPGIDADQLDIQFTDGMLTIRALAEEPPERTDGTWHMRERRTDVNERTVPIPRAADIDEAEATLDKGVLTIIFPIIEPASKRRIQIKSKSREQPPLD